VGLNGMKIEAFKLSRLVRQGCPPASFLYLFVADYLGYLLENTNNIKGISLPGDQCNIINYEFANDTNLYLEGTSKNLANVKTVLDLFAMAAGTRINWHKSNAILEFDQPRGWTW
jgi:hypothetical protein